MVFALIIIFSIVPLRRIGWAISKNILYVMPLLFSIVLTIGWAFLISYLLHILIRWQNPNIIVKILLGYGFGVYLAIPNFALFDLNTLPPEEIKRTAFIYGASLGMFILGSIFLAFF